ncbi:MAG: sigma-70 family RNA polymerase sigma factor [Pseudomonadales bacterium]|nr:sigma-70 family RNA polymerase sigma factor [Pseudomonadales bacterium]
MTELVTSAPTQAPTATATEATDDSLISLYLTGDQAAFEQLYGRYKTSLYGYFRRQLPDAMANDAFQDTWIRLIDSLQKYQANEQFSGYLFTIAHNTLMDYHRKQARNPEVTNDDAIEFPAQKDDEPDRVQDRAETLRNFQNELKKLPIQQRSAWVLKQETNFSNEEIARLTDTSAEGVKSRLRYASEKLKAGMQKYVSR